MCFIQAGVTDIVLAVNYRPEIMVRALKEYEELYNVKITFSVETEPLGTAGPLALAREILAKDDSPFFVLNSDVICDYPFEQLRDFHLSHGNEGTIVVTKVDDPSKYGVIVNRPDSSRIDRFVEKPKEFISNKINAGIYVLSPKILDRIQVSESSYARIRIIHHDEQLKPTSIEKEVFPFVAQDGQLHTFDLEGFWMDVGQPKDFLTGTCLYLSHLSKKNPEALANPTLDYVHKGNVMVHPTAKIGKNCRIGPNVVIGPNVEIGDGVRLQRCVVLQGAKVKDYAWVQSTIIGWHSSVGRWVSVSWIHVSWIFIIIIIIQSRLEGCSVLGDDVTIKDEIYVNGGSILPHKSISANITEPQIIM